MRKNHFFTAIVFLLVASVFGCFRSSGPVAESVSTGVVTIKVEFDDQVQTLTMDDVSDGATLETVLRNVENPVFVIKGRGKTAFVDSIGDQSTGASEGWTFLIDGEFANEGIGSAALHPPTTVTWKFGGMDGGP